MNLATAKQAEAVVRNSGAVPATIAVLDGVPTIGLRADQLQQLATQEHVEKASRRDLGYVVARRATAATTVAATMALAYRAGIKVFATGGIGGVHTEPQFDVSADLFELARVPVLVVCAGAKNILDLRATLEVLETYSVPVVGYQTRDFPAFYVAKSGLTLTMQANDPRMAALIAADHWRFMDSGLVLAQRAPTPMAADEFEDLKKQAKQLARAQNVVGANITPFVLRQLATLSNGRTVEVNRELIVANAELAGKVAVELFAIERD
jgi:pseudouridine-5'-phosphate glycosidase